VQDGGAHVDVGVVVHITPESVHARSLMAYLARRTGRRFGTTCLVAYAQNVHIRATIR
jgi:hypothetical protein